MRINPPTLFWILVAAIVATHWYLPLIAFDESWFPWVGAVVFVLGIGVSAAGKRQFQQVGTNVYTFEDPGEFVTDGLYGISRNPMYLGLVLAGAGAALISATLAAIVLSAVFAVTVRYWYIAFEERAMHRRFGEAYEAYCRRVGRWIGRRRTGASPGSRKPLPTRTES